MVNSVAKMDEFCKENMFTAWYETSAKENVHIDDAAKTLVSQVTINYTVLIFRNSNTHSTYKYILILLRIHH